MLHAVARMSTSNSLLDRIAAAIAQSTTAPNPRAVAVDNAWRICGYEGWADAWSEAESTQTVNDNPDTGARTNVITDEMIETAVGDVLAGLLVQESTGTTRVEPDVVPPEQGGPVFEHAH